MSPATVLLCVGEWKHFREGMFTRSGAWFSGAGLQGFVRCGMETLRQTWRGWRKFIGVSAR